MATFTEKMLFEPFSSKLFVSCYYYKASKLVYYFGILDSTEYSLPSVCPYRSKKNSSDLKVKRSLSLSDRIETLNGVLKSTLILKVFA